MTSLPQTGAPQDQRMSPADAKRWRECWQRAAEMDRQLRAKRIQSIDWERDWPWIDDLLSLGAKFAKPRLPTSLIEYRRRLAKWLGQ